MHRKDAIPGTVVTFKASKRAGEWQYSGIPHGVPGVIIGHAARPTVASSISGDHYVSVRWFDPDLAYDKRPGWRNYKGLQPPDCWRIPLWHLEKAHV